MTKTINCAQADTAIRAGTLLVDIREPDEYAREHIPGSINIPLSRINTLKADGEPVLFHCRSGMRTAANAETLKTAAQGAPCMIMEGGLDAWRQAGLPTAVDRRQPLEIMRQVQLTAGALVLIGVLLGFLVAPAFFGLSAFVGAGLMFAGATGWCGMATLLRVMPWNKPRTA